MQVKSPLKSRPVALKLFLMGVFVLSFLLSSCGENKPKQYRVGILCGVNAFAPVADSLKAEMAKLGYEEGKNIVYDLQLFNADPEGVKRAAKKFVADKVDLIFAITTDPALVAKKAVQGTDIPVVFANASIEWNDLVESVRKPGGNITGVRFPGPDLVAKRLEILISLAPKAKRIFVTYDRNYPNIEGVLKVLRPAASSAGVKLVEVPVTNMEGIRADLQARGASDDIGVDAIAIMPEALSQSPPAWALITQFADKHGLPIAGAAPSTADRGAVFSYTPNILKLGKLAAPLADKVLRGTKAGTIPLVTPEAYLRLNYKKAKELGLTVPDNLLSLASEIIR
jgi:putative ABC transport system substrate-binding protein